MNFEIKLNNRALFLTTCICMGVFLILFFYRIDSIISIKEDPPILLNLGTAPMSTSSPTNTQSSRSTPISSSQSLPSEQTVPDNIGDLDVKRKEAEKARQREKEKREKERREREERAATLNSQMQAAFQNPSQTESTNEQSNSGTSENVPQEGANGNSWELSGRSLIGVLPVPVYSINEEANVVIKVYVGREGKVVRATVDPARTNTLNQTLLKAARQAAMLAVFSAKTDAQIEQIGYITYRFRLNR